MRNEYTDHPATCAPEDYWGQVRRTIGGRPVPEEQIGLIVANGMRSLDLAPADRLLDLCCGNGALTDRWFERCAGGLGVDASEPLIEVARRDFAGPEREYLLASVLDFACEPERFGARDTFTKASCFASLQYLATDRVGAWLADLRTRFGSLQRLWIGNVPDRERIEAFAEPGADLAADDPSSAIGCWWSPDALLGVAERAGWRGEVRSLDASFYQAHYRFDVLLTPNEVNG